MHNSRKTYSQIERTGIHRVGTVFYEQFDWIFREQPIVDFGIDATVEEKVNGTPTGKLIALQIKSGNSHFYKSKTSHHVNFYFDEKHFDYWINYSLPVILVGYLPSDSLLLWQSINEENVIKCKKGYKIQMNHKLDVLERDNLKELFYPFFVRKVQEIGKLNNTTAWIEEIKMKVNQKGLPLEYNYPIIKSENKYLEKSINYQIREKVFETLEIEYFNLNIVDTYNILSGLKDYYFKHFNGGIMFVEYEVFRNDNKILSLCIASTSIAAHPIYYRNYFCFDLKTGNQLSIKHLINPFKIDQFVSELNKVRKQRYNNTIIEKSESEHDINV
jgi:Domain of unknown function (DUF4365)